MIVTQDLKELEKQLKVKTAIITNENTTKEGKELTTTEETALSLVNLCNPEYFKPTVKQRKLKSAFHMACKSRPTNKAEITLDFVLKFIISKDIKSWWDVPGFQMWFKKEEVIADRLAHLYQLRLDAIEQVLSDESEVYTAKDKISAGSELDKIAKTLTEAADSLNAVSKDTRSMEEKVSEAMAKARANTVKAEESKRVQAAPRDEKDLPYKLPGGDDLVWRDLKRE
jgi:hypothetical protein